MNLRFVHLLLAAGIAILGTACKEGNIYYTLENEVKVEDLSLPNDITVFDVTKVGSSYYAAAGKIWAVADTAAQWDVNALVDPPSPGDICTSLVASPFGATLYGGFINGSGGLGLYESTAAPSPSFAGASLIGRPGFETSTKLDGAQVALLKAVAHPTEKLTAVVTAKATGLPKYEFWVVTSDGSGFTDLNITRDSGEEVKPINDVIYSSRIGLGVWFATEGNRLYSGTGPLTRDSIIPSDAELRGLYDDGTNIYVATKEGVVYWTADTALPITTWTPISALAISGVNPPLTRFEMLDVTTEKILLVGSDGYGYYRLPTNPIGSLTRFPTTTSDLYTASVMKFFYDDDPGINRVFACTAMGGLWRGAVAADGTIDWNLE